jgi:putative ABC transport system substrate-binding protein
MRPDCDARSIHRDKSRIDRCAGLPLSHPGNLLSSLYAQSGGLISYGVDFVRLFRQSAGYIDRILKGAKPADLPVQLPTKLELVINLKAAKALGLSVPLSLLGRADEVIE